MPSGNTGNKITSIRYCKNKVVITVNKLIRLELPHEVFTSFYIYKGKLLSDKEFSEINEKMINYALLSYARKLSFKKMYTERKMREKLYLKDANKKNVDAVIKELKKSNLIDDESYMNEYVEFANNKNVGKNKIVAKLKEKGVFSEKTNKLSFKEADEIRKARNRLPTLEKKYDKYNNVSKKDHIIKALISEGFDTDVAIEVAGEMKLNSSKSELEKLNRDYDTLYKRYSRKHVGEELRKKLFDGLMAKGYKAKDIVNIWEGK